MDDIDLTFDRLKRSSYHTLHTEMIARFGRLYEVTIDEKIYWPDGALDVINKHGWTTKELFDKVQEIYDEKQSRLY